MRGWRCGQGEGLGVERAAREGSASVPLHDALTREPRRRHRTCPHWQAMISASAILLLAMGHPPVPGEGWAVQGAVDLLTTGGVRGSARDVGLGSQGKRRYLNPEMDFGPSAQDYAQHRQTFPSSFFERVPLRGDVLDLGAGTGALARGYAQRGARVVALDLSRPMLGQANDLPSRVAARAEACPFRAASFDAVTAGQCWHWFNGPAVAHECRRLLRSGGTIVIAHFNYLPLPESAAQASEALILERQPGWPLAGIWQLEGRWDAQLRAADFQELTSFAYELDVAYTHDAWRGRMRACNGVISLGPERISEYDAALAQVLSRDFPEPLLVRHRVFALKARAP